jgi:hypothetical protein
MPFQVFSAVKKKYKEQRYLPEIFYTDLLMLCLSKNILVLVVMRENDLIG